MKLVTSVVAGKTPRDGTTLGIALCLQRGNALTQVLHTLHTTRQTATGKDANLDFCHIEPTSMLRGVMELHPLQNPSRLRRRVRLIERGSRMCVQVILHDAHVFG